MAEVIAITSQKGGCGKTTTALNLALALAELGKRTLLVDIDPQGAVGLSLRQSDLEHAGIAEVLARVAETKDVIVQTKNPHLALLTRGRLDAADVCEFELELYQQSRLKQIITESKCDYDFVLIDTPSGLGLPTRAALSCADFALVPLQAEPLALRSVSQVLRVIERARESSNPTLLLLGILATMVAKEEEPSMNVLIASWRELGGVFDTVIPRDPIFARASEAGVPLTYLAGKTPIEAKRFGMLAVEITSRIEQLRCSKEVEDEEAERRLL